MSTSTWLLLLVVFVPAVMIAVVRNEGRRSAGRAATEELEVTGDGVTRRLADGRVEQVAWHEIEVVEVVRARWGPHASYGGVVLIGAGERGCLVPIDRVGSSGVLGHLSTLPGFDLARFSEALEARPPSRQVVWEPPGSPS